MKMSDNHVAMEKKMCIVCAKDYETGAVLLSTRFDRIENRFVPIGNPRTGMGMCPACEALKAQGYIAIVGAIEHTNTRTGTYAHIKEDAWHKIFTMPVPGKMVAFAGPDVMDFLAKLEAQSKEN